MNIFQLETKSDVAEVLKVSERRLNYFLYGLKKSGEQYKLFEIPKRNGGKRVIEAPAYGLKKIQRGLSDILYESIQQKHCSFAFNRDKSKGIKGNASSHKKRRWVVNLDLSDFFTSIHFGRVRGLFMSSPFNHNDKVATLLAQVACCDGHLAMGAPSSPILSDLVCRRLDNQLLAFARANRLTYTRYADDITFSTNLHTIPSNLGVIEDGVFRVGENLRTIIEDNNGFIINREKVHYSSFNNRQQVTGLIVNEKVNVSRRYVRQVRAMLYAWKKYGKTAAAVEHFQRYKPMQVEFPESRFVQELQGRITFIGNIKGRDNHTYTALCGRLWELEPKAPLKVRYNPDSFDAVVYCEGATDPIHIKAALSYFQSHGKYTTQRVFWVLYNKEQQNVICNAELKNSLNYQKRWKISDKVEIYLFDRDDPRFLDMEDADGNPKYYGHGLYSMLLPVVPHRKSPKVCIEHYYSNEDLLQKDSFGRRIYLSTEFDKTSGLCKNEEVTTLKKRVLNYDYEYIISDSVTDQNDKSVALSKMAFARYVESQQPPFDNMDFSHFSLIFDRVEMIIEDHKQRMRKGQG